MLSKTSHLRYAFSDVWISKSNEKRDTHVEFQRANRTEMNNAREVDCNGRKLWVEAKVTALGCSYVKALVGV